MTSLPPSRATAGLSQHSNTTYTTTTTSKSRGRAIVKPILKKLNSHSNSDRGSLDLDPVWDDLPSPLSYPSGDYDAAYSDTTPALAPGVYDIPPLADGMRPRDVSFSPSASAEYPTWRSRIKYSHMRSTSGTSHTSSITTNVSVRNGTFIHPFQQTPRTATPSLSYANSIASLDTCAPATREYTSAVTDSNDGISPATASNLPLRSASLTKAATYSAQTPTYTLNSRFRGASLDQTPPSGTFPDGTLTPRLTPTSRSNSATTALYMPESSHTDSVLLSTAPQIIAPTVNVASSATPTSPSPLSPLRNSLDLNGFRLRSRSEVDTRTHQEQVREARRKFQEKEKAKEEKYARQQLRRRDRADQHCERGKIRKGRHSKSQGTEESSHEKVDFDLDDTAYDCASTGQTAARADEVQFQRPKRHKTAKHKTNGVWTAFVLWLRTRLLRLGKH